MASRPRSTSGKLLVFLRFLTHAGIRAVRSQNTDCMSSDHYGQKNDSAKRLFSVLAWAEVRGDAFSTTQFRDALLPAQPLEYDAHPLFRGELPARAAANLPHCGLSGLLAFLAHLETLLGVQNPVKCLLV